MKRFLSIFLMVAVAVQAAEPVLAELDATDTRAFWEGTVGARVGKWHALGPIGVGGMVEVQNEPRFHQGALPNHRWRGVARLGGEIPLLRTEVRSWSLPIEVRHESSHATMGIEESTINPYQMIFDGNYRNTNRNALVVGNAFSWHSTWSGRVQLEGIKYVMSRNTPEASNTALTHAWGVAMGMETRLPIGNWAILASAWFRQEYAGAANALTRVYYATSNGLENLSVSYPIFASTHTILAALAIEMPWFEHKVSLYGQILQGNLGGFVDSRDSRKVLSAGIRIR